MKVTIFDLNGKSAGEHTLDSKVFGVDANPSLIAQYIRVFRTNQRQGTSKTKDRSEVRGGGKKPWKQKGTGRARAGSIRSPIWVGGGRAHGPTPKSWTLQMPKRMKRAAMRSILSVKASKNQVVVLENLELKEAKTKPMEDLLKKLKLGGRVLIVTSEMNKNAIKSAGNLSKVSVSLADNLNGYALMNAHHVVFEKEAVKKIEEKYNK